MKAWENFTTEFDDRTPIYRQIYGLFSRSFARGLIKTGERIPSIRDMALQLKVNANTMQRVYHEMERDGLINSKRGTGYFFTEEKTMVEKVSTKMAQESIGRFLEEMRSLGFADKDIVNELSEQIKGEKRGGGHKDENNTFAS
ncbi:MAG: GntR family transcriptional regulator [Oscillospiraceae bacterium]|nr:GntR family transcriptional regulator [Oscillospiraceae bacterium]